MIGKRASISNIGQEGDLKPDGPRRMVVKLSLFDFIP